MKSAAEKIQYMSATDPVSVLKQVEDYLILDRDCLYETVSDKNGDIPDFKDQEDLEALDKLIDNLIGVRKKLEANHA